MKISSRFSIAVHIMTVIALMETKQKMTSAYLAACISTNPVVIRKITGQLKKSGLVDIKSGEGGATLLKNPAEISLFDIYQAVEVVEDISLFNSHNKLEVKCPVDCCGCPLTESREKAADVTADVADTPHSDRKAACCCIHMTIDNQLLAAQKAMEDSLKKVTIGGMIEEMISAANPNS